MKVKSRTFAKQTDVSTDVRLSHLKIVFFTLNLHRRRSAWRAPRTRRRTRSTAASSASCATPRTRSARCSANNSCASEKRCVRCEKKKPCKTRIQDIVEGGGVMRGYEPHFREVTQAWRRKYCKRWIGWVGVGALTTRLSWIRAWLSAKPKRCTSCRTDTPPPPETNSVVFFWLSNSFTLFVCSRGSEVFEHERIQLISPILSCCLPDPSTTRRAPSAIIVVHMHFSVNTTIEIHETHSWCAVTLACVCAGARGVALGSHFASVNSVGNGSLGSSLGRPLCVTPLCCSFHTDQTRAPALYLVWPPSHPPPRVNPLADPRDRPFPSQRGFG